MSSRSGEPIMIPLTNGGTALVDEEDFCLVDGFKWYKVRRNDRWYAERRFQDGGRSRNEHMHRRLFGLNEGDHIDVDHINHDGLDNRRSCNLRLATRSQNQTNKRKLTWTASKYKGVCAVHRDNKWRCMISTRIGGVQRHYFLGSYPSEGEAAFAYNVGAPLILDSRFVYLSVIDNKDLPSLSRQFEIRKLVISKIKFLVSGKKGRIDSTSQYYGVTRKPSGRWVARIRQKSNLIELGTYNSEIEAAFARRHAVQLLNGRRFARDIPIDDHSIDQDRIASMREHVEHVIAFRLAGGKGRCQS